MLGPQWVPVAVRGRTVALRWGTPADRAELVYGFEHLSPASRMTRFFSPMPRLDGVVLSSLLDVGAPHHIAVAAFELDDDGHTTGHGLGVARLITDHDAPDTAEYSIAVVDQAQGLGIGRLLTDALVVTAPRCGVERIEAFVRVENHAMIDLLTHLGAQRRPMVDEPGVVEFELDVATALARVRADHPERIEALAALAALPLP